MNSIALDMDGVMADVYKQFYEMDERDFGVRRKQEAVDGTAERKAFPYIDRYVNEAGFFSTVPVMEGCLEVVEQLNRNYELFIVSAAMEFPLSLAEKRSWLGEHFPFITWRQVVFCGSKEIIRTAIMIDDHFHNLNSFTGSRTLLFTQPHNIFTDPGKHTRVANWTQVGEVLL